MISMMVGRTRGLLDIYSVNPINRLAVITTFAAGVVTLLQSINTGSAVGAIPILLLVWANHERFLGTAESLLERNGWLLLGIPLSVLFAKLLMSPPTAIDDLLRHIASAYWPGGYGDMYAYSALPPVDLYPGFDALVAALTIGLGPAPAMWIMQGLALVGFLSVLVLGAGRLLGSHPLKGPFALAALVLILPVMEGRLYLARPEIFLTIWAMAALLPRGRVGVLVWACSGVVLGSGYWLAALYFPAVLLLPISRSGRIAVFAFLAVTWTAMWHYLADGDLVRAIAWTFEQVGNRIDGIQVSENMSIVNLMLHPLALALTLGAVWVFSARRDFADSRLIVLAGYFALSNQTRYGGIIIPLLALYVLSGLRGLHVSCPARLRCSMVALASCAFSLYASSVPAFATLPRFQLPAGSTVLTAFNEATYSTPFFNPGRVRVSPAFEIGALEPAVQRIVKDLAEGNLDCDRLQGYRFTHVIEKSLSGQTPSCLTLEASQRNWRLWRVIR